MLLIINLLTRKQTEWP